MTRTLSLVGSKLYCTVSFLVERTRPKACLPQKEMDGNALIPFPLQQFCKGMFINDLKFEAHKYFFEILTHLGHIHITRKLVCLFQGWDGVPELASVPPVPCPLSILILALKENP